MVNLGEAYRKDGASHTGRCEPHGQIKKRRTKYPLPNPLPRRGSVVTEKWDEGMMNKRRCESYGQIKKRRTKNERMTNKERTKDEQMTNK